jgi:cell division septum initiation protein DivIVA
MVYVQNKYTSDIKLNLNDGGKTTSVLFKRYQVDRLTGQVVESGYTQVEDELEARLQESKAFKNLVTTGKLVLCKEVPLTVNTLERCMQLQSENASLKQQIKQLQFEIAELKKAKAEPPKEAEAEPVTKKKGKK